METQDDPQPKKKKENGNSTTVISACVRYIRYNVTSCTLNIVVMSRNLNLLVLLL
jgi:hypothetical protein